VCTARLRELLAEPNQAARLSVQPHHNIFENFSCGPECRPIIFFANFYNFNKASMSRN